MALGQNSSTATSIFVSGTNEVRARPDLTAIIRKSRVDRLSLDHMRQLYYNRRETQIIINPRGISKFVPVINKQG